jgi:formylglycine-generating enzyme required for sulfatase activity
VSDSERPEERKDDPVVDAAVLEFIRRVDEGEVVDVDRFAADQPEPVRALVAERCRQFLDVQRVLRHMREPVAAAHESKEQPPDPMIGRTLGDFRIVDRIGKGGMGVVYLARQGSLPRDVAIKVLPAPMASKRGRTERFAREARAPARLDHPGIVKILENHQDSEPRWYAMEFVAGRSLQDLLRDMKKLPTSDPAGLPAAMTGWIPRAAQVAAEAAEALEHAHTRGVIHRDVKPHNLLIDERGVVRIVDFGLAIDRADEDLSQPGDVLGTPHYMSPEQARADRAKVDWRTDVYSLGVVLYEMLTLRRPFEGASRDRVLHAIATELPRPVRKLNPRVPRDLETICLEAMEKNPVHRYARAGDFARDLRHFLNHEAIEAKPPPPWRKLGLHLRRRRQWLFGFAVGAALLALLGVAWRVHERRAALPKLTVEGGDDAVGADVYLRPVELVGGGKPDEKYVERIGERVRIGAVPLSNFPIETPGLYRIVVERPGVGFCEATRPIDGRTGDVKVHAWIRSTVSVEKGMVRIAAGEFQWGNAEERWPFLHDEHALLDDFLIDADEVSNADYEEYLDACAAANVTDRGEPKFWQYGYQRRSDDEREPRRRQPVVGVSWLDAARYAEWAGKRLPTSREWEKAARGTDGRTYPWGNDVERLDRLFPEPAKAVTANVADGRATWIAATSALEPVGRDERAVSPFGLRHVLGSAWEWTESVRLELVGVGATPSYDDRYVKGIGWFSLRDYRRSLGLKITECEHTTYDSVDMGFRCAKSIRP